MLRKSLVAALILLYSATAIGVPLHFHYCRGELKHVSFLLKMECHVPETGTAEHACCKTTKPQCGNGQTLNSCCDDATQWIQDDLPAICAKSDLDQLSGLTAMIPASVPTIEYALHHILPSTDHDFQQVHPPLYLLQCAFIFYG